MNAQTLLKENTNLLCENTDLHNQLGSLETENQSLISKLLAANSQLEWLKRQIFGKRSEKVISKEDQEQLHFEGFTIEEPQKKGPTPVKGHARKKNKGKDTITLPSDLPIEKQYIDLPEEKKVCPQTKKPLEKIGEEITSKLAYKPGSYYIKQTIRPKYATPEGSIKTAPLPESLLDRCQADESLLAHIIIQKYVDHIPLYRTSEILRRGDIWISRQTLCKWVMRCGKTLKPLYEELQKQILQSKNIFVDETPIPLQAKGKTHQAYIWVIAGGKGSDPPYRTYHFRLTRKHEHAEKLLKNYQGTFHSDKYGCYEKLAKEKRFTWCPCYSHIRRKFFEAEGGKFREKILRKIRYLFLYERVAWARSPEERLKIRQEKETLLIDELIQMVQEKLKDHRVLPKSKLREALGYLCSLTPYLKNYTKHSEARLDNNVAERAIRPLALGRKNYLFVGSEEGGEVAAILYSLVQSCKAAGVNPQEYLVDVMKRLMSHNSQKLYELLPDQWANTRTLVDTS
jgi:transposase